MFRILEQFLLSHSNVPPLPINVPPYTSNVRPLPSNVLPLPSNVPPLFFSMCSVSLSHAPFVTPSRNLVICDGMRSRYVNMRTHRITVDWCTCFCRQSMNQSNPSTRVSSSGYLSTRNGSSLMKLAAMRLKCFHSFTLILLHNNYVCYTMYKTVKSTEDKNRFMCSAWYDTLIKH